MEPCGAGELLTVEALTKRYDGVQALRGADLTVRAGEIHALLGENGAGKSTLIKALAGAIQPDSGTITFQGEQVAFGSPTGSMRRGISVIFQHANLVPQLTVAQNVVLGGEQRRLGFLRDDGQREAVREAFATLGTNIDLNRTAANLRSGERQLVEIARALLRRARLLILDEPTASLGTQEVEHLHRTLLDLRRSGLGIIYVSHRLEEVLSVSDEVTVLRDGRTVARRPAAGSTPRDVINLMIGRDAAHVFRKSSDARETVVLKANGLTTDTGLSEVSFELRAGEILGVFGLLGSGRTELARALFGADPIRSGSIETDGAVRGRRTPYRSSRTGMGLVPEERSLQALFAQLTIVDNMTSGRPWLYSRFGFIRKSRRRGLVTDMARRLRLRTASVDQTVSTLSGGNQQKVVLGRWMLGDSRILILDDPTVGVDVGAKEEIYRLISELTADGTAVVLLSSELPEVVGLSDRIMVLFRGRVHTIVNSGDLSEAALLGAAHGEAA
ncbi:MAG TPA: sugar ABC transporter ATP-binding protein [Pseudonocardiaceae bacterium]|jgi:ribose transport system ATP-binding protein